MDIMTIIMTAIIVAGIGLFIAIFLEVAGKKLYVEVDERVEAITQELPGNNCGGCGYPGCANLAGAIVDGNAKIDGCPVGGSSVAAMIGAIMGQDATQKEPLVAFVHCGGTCDKAKQDYVYTGQANCQMVKTIANGGPKTCNYGCLGFGTCKDACSFGAIEIVNGIAVINKDLCKACGQCVGVCPQGLISLVKQKESTKVVCNSKGKGKEVMVSCTVGCIGCGMCARVCEQGAITMVDNLPVIDEDKCTHCGLCIEKCPKKCLKEI
ncbi:RnfABCDGE type electron transport complex subunit B [Tannockella kyphosi]|uniref:RnfABCDGE type electron transport complex subunit B n=1 Tax=Tannockella kyphosi TaxID=2899121 RepID=UPI002011183F|nr:RnfABCDGE type electron transport complex subunit B [Tannockella kyphosi]